MTYFYDNILLYSLGEVCRPCSYIDGVYELPVQ